MEFLLPLLTGVAGAAATGAFAIHRLKGDRTFVQALLVVIRGGGGPGEERSK